MRASGVCVKEANGGCGSGSKGGSGCSNGVGVDVGVGKSAADIAREEDGGIKGQRAKGAASRCRQGGRRRVA